MHRARRLYHDREAVVDGARRWTYGEFFARVDRWSSALQTLEVRRGDDLHLVVPVAVHEAVLARVTDAAGAAGFRRVGMTPSPITGATGNQEFFLHLR